MDEDKNITNGAGKVISDAVPNSKGESPVPRFDKRNNRFRNNRGRGGRPQESGEKRSNVPLQKDGNPAEQKTTEQTGQPDQSDKTVQPNQTVQKKFDRPIKKNGIPRYENRNDSRNGDNRSVDNRSVDNRSGDNRSGDNRSGDNRSVDNRSFDRNNDTKRNDNNRGGRTQPKQDKRQPENNNNSNNLSSVPAVKAADKNEQPKPDVRNVQNGDRRPDRNRRPPRSERQTADTNREPPNVIDDDASVYLPELLRPSTAKSAFVPDSEPEPESTPGVYTFPDDTAQLVFGDAPVEKPEKTPDEPVDKVEIVDVRFKLSGKTYYFSPNGMSLAKDQNVIVETARGIEFGTVVQANRMVPLRDIVPPLKNVLRLATDEDKARRAANEEKEINAFNVCLEKIEAHKLDMKLVDAEYTFDNSKLLFYFSAEGRVDFRELARDLASVFRTRIELRQIGIRDEAKMMGGLGICGRPLCCSTFLSDFGQVSIKMAKEQSLSLNSAKISGTCGRLMCCLRYEYGTYAEEIAKTPRVDSMVETPDGPGLVTEISPLAGLVKVRLQKDPDQPPQLYHRSDLKPLGNAKQQAEIADGSSEAVPDATVSGTGVSGAAASGTAVSGTAVSSPETDADTTIDTASETIDPELKRLEDN